MTNHLLNGIIDKVESSKDEKSQLNSWKFKCLGYVEDLLIPKQLGVFIHIPKTAGITVYCHTSEIAPRMFARHGTALFVCDKIGNEAWERLFTFAFVRNPWSRMVSMFRYYQINEFCGEDETFNFWLNSFIHNPQVRGEQYTDIVPRAPITQKTFLTDLEGTVIVKFIGKMENFNHDFAFVCQKLGIPANPTIKNKMPPVDWHEFYNSSTRQSILEACHWEIENFGYTFDDD